MKPYSKKLSLNEPHSCNCVLWARTKVASLPYGLWTLNDKKKIINKKNPKKGYIAIIDVGLFGHVALVTKVSEKHVTIQEANYYTCHFSERHDTPKNLKIVGYYKG